MIPHPAATHRGTIIGDCARISKLSQLCTTPAYKKR
jgi:hypothetical protein